MAEAAEAKYLAQLRAELGSWNWWVWAVSKPAERKRVPAPTRFQAMVSGGRFFVGAIDCEVCR